MGKDELIGMIPNLFIVGAQRSGTTSLYYYLKEHSRVFFPYPKEPHHFCTDFIRECEEFHTRSRDSRDICTKYFRYQDRSEYLRLFEQAESAKIIGDASASYLFSKEAAKNIFRFNPEAKIIISLRNPVDQIYSYHFLLLHSYQDFNEDFETTLGLEPLRKNDHSKVPAYIRVPSVLFYTERMRYLEQIHRYVNYFPVERIKLIIFDDLLANPMKTYMEILEFLNLPEEDYPDFSTHNPSKVVKRWWLKKITEYKPLGNFPRIILPQSVYERIVKVLSAMTKINYRYPPLDPMKRIELMQSLKSEVKALEDYLKRLNLLRSDRMLSEIWGYDNV